MTRSPGAVLSIIQIDWRTLSSSLTIAMRPRSSTAIGSFHPVPRKLPGMGRGAPPLHRLHARLGERDGEGRSRRRAERLAVLEEHRLAEHLDAQRATQPLGGDART